MSKRRRTDSEDLLNNDDEKNKSNLKITLNTPKFKPYIIPAKFESSDSDDEEYHDRKDKKEDKKE